LHDFTTCFEAADALFLMPIYAASETPIAGIDHEMLARMVAETGRPGKVFVTQSRTDAVEKAAAWAQDGDTVVTQGAGDVTRAGDELVSRL
jgi:UDP-N-acetylmuramate--alanine ligase